MKKEENVIVEKSYKFAFRIIKLFKSVSNEQHEYILSKQVLRCGTSIGALMQETGHSESNADFIHNLQYLIKRLMSHNTG